MYIKKTNKQAILHAKEQQIIKYEMLNIETRKKAAYLCTLIIQNSLPI